MAPTSFILLLSFVIILVGTVLVARMVYRHFRDRKVHFPRSIVAIVTLLPVTIVVVLNVMARHLDENPTFSSPAEIIGTYTDAEGHRSLTVNADGTFTSRGLPEPTAGTWVHRDQGFTLTLTNNTTRSREVRFIRRNRTLCIAPEWEEKDGHTDLVLEKQSP